MSDTPRTDATTSNINYEPPCKKLERERNQLVKQLIRNVEEIGELRAALVICEKKELMSQAVLKSWKEDEGADARRLEFIVENIYGIDRAIIDQQMKEEQAK